MATESPTEPLEPSNPISGTTTVPQVASVPPSAYDCPICHEQIIGQYIRSHRATHNRLQCMTREQAARNARWIAHIKELLNGPA